MQVLFATVKGLMALGIAMLFIDDVRAQVPIEEDAGTITMTGTVEEIIVPERVLMVVGPGGNTVVGVISPDVKDITKIKLKENVTIQYSQEVAVALRKADGPPAAAQDGFEANETSDMGLDAPTVAEQDWTNLTPSGGVANLETIEITETIAALNKRKRTVTFAGTGGKTRTIYVPPSVQGFDALEVGDMIVLEVTRASIVNVKIS
ncbi:MAG: hypothetical protein ACSLE4_01835 [Methyloceanibacter sp.]|uniref:hypothetical protein n=1 Tax=Methyloceanibacter sp. TaxID=1965321 RepID=UPI003EE0C906